MTLVCGQGEGNNWKKRPDNFIKKLKKFKGLGF